MPFVAVQNTTIDLAKAFAGENGYEPSAPVLMASGALAGVAAQTVVYPLDVLRRRVQLDRAGLGALGTLRAVVAREGWRALFAGIVPTYLKTVPAVATTATVCVSLVSHFKQANAASS